MNIEISTTEYRDLLDILHIADVVMAGHRREEDPRTRGHRAVIQKLYALAQAGGLGRLIGRDLNASRYVPTAEFEQSSLAHAAIDEFGEHLFWDQLISRLTERDAAAVAVVSAPSDSEHQNTEELIRQRYIEEFARNGIANLMVIDRFLSGSGMPVKTSD